MGHYICKPFAVLDEFTIKPCSLSIVHCEKRIKLQQPFINKTVKRVVEGESWASIGASNCLAYLPYGPDGYVFVISLSLCLQYTYRALVIAQIFP